jgi:hypothetical protein
MRVYAERKPTSTSAQDVAILRERNGRREHSRVGAQQCVSCEIGQSLPTAGGHVWSYYLSQADGRQMLVLNRRKGERIRINDTVEVVVLDIQEGRVQLGVVIPRDALPDGRQSCLVGWPLSRRSMDKADDNL